jgi:hypothetical protein
VPRWLRPLERGFSVEHCCEEGKGEVGLDHSEVRSQAGDGIVTSLCVCSLTPFWWLCERRVRCSWKILEQMNKKNGGNPPRLTPFLTA